MVACGGVLAAAVHRYLNIGQCNVHLELNPRRGFACAAGPARRRRRIKGSPRRIAAAVRAGRAGLAGQRGIARHRALGASDGYGRTLCREIAKRSPIKSNGQRAGATVCDARGEASCVHALNHNIAATQVVACGRAHDVRDDHRRCGVGLREGHAHRHRTAAGNALRGAVARLHAQARQQVAASTDLCDAAVEVHRVVALQLGVVFGGGAEASKACTARGATGQVQVCKRPWDAARRAVALVAVAHNQQEVPVASVGELRRHRRCAAADPREHLGDGGVERRRAVRGRGRIVRAGVVQLRAVAPALEHAAAHVGGELDGGRDAGGFIVRRAPHVQRNARVIALREQVQVFAAAATQFADVVVVRAVVEVRAGDDAQAEVRAGRR